MSFLFVILIALMFYITLPLTNKIYRIKNIYFHKQVVLWDKKLSFEF